MAEITDLNVTDASNTARMPENQAPSSVNNGVRALEGILARGFKDALEGDKDSTGSANAYLVAANRTISAYYDGLRVGFHASFGCTGSSTLDYDSVGAKTIKKNHDVNLVNGDIETNQYVEAVYSATDDTWQMLSPTALAQFDVDNLRLNGNTLSSTDTNGDINLTPNGTGSVVASAEIEAPLGTTGAPGYSFSGDPDTGMYSPGANQLALSVGNTDAFNIDAAGIIQMAVQSAFLAYNSANDDNVTGNGATATIDFNTEIYDNNANFAADTFTAPVFGKYHLSTTVRIDGLVSASRITIFLATSNNSYRAIWDSPPDSVFSATLDVVADMDASDTALVQVVVTGMAGDTADIFGDATNRFTFFSGCLLA